MAKKSKKFKRFLPLKRVKTCASCLNVVTTYPRKLSVTNVGPLLFLYKHFGHNWFDSAEVSSALNPIGMRGRDWYRAKYWGLVEQKSGVQATNGASQKGIWRVTELFAECWHNDIKLPFWFMVLKDVPLEQDPDVNNWLTLREALGECFDYQELMASAIH